LSQQRNPFQRLLLFVSIDAPSIASADQTTVASPSMRKRQRTLEMHSGSTAATDPHQPGAGVVAPVGDDAFIDDHDEVDSGGEDDEDDEKPKSDKKAGRRKIKIEYIPDKSRRHITFSKRKAGKVQSNS